MECWVRVPPTEVSLIAGQSQAGRECKMAHSCRWRFPARPGGSSNSGTGRRAGRIRVTASLRSVLGAHPNAAGLGPGFDAALQVSSVIESNLQKFRDVLGESSDSSSGEVSTGRDKISQMVPDGPSMTAAEHGFARRAFRYEELTVTQIKRLSFSLAASSVERGKLVIFRMLTDLSWLCGLKPHSYVLAGYLLLNRTQTQQHSFIVQTPLLEESLLHLSSVWG